MTKKDELTTFQKMRAIDVSAHIEKKGKFNYLSWAWAVDQLLNADNTANWEFGESMIFPDKTMMVCCTVSAFGIARKMHLPVMDGANKPIASPNAFQVNTAMQRCLVKAIAAHGLGLYIYAGEDLPEPVIEKKRDESVYLGLLHDLNFIKTKDVIVAWQSEKEELIDGLPEDMSKEFSDMLEDHIKKIESGFFLNEGFSFKAKEAAEWMTKSKFKIEACKSVEELEAWESDKDIDGVPNKVKLAALSTKENAEGKSQRKTMAALIDAQLKLLTKPEQNTIIGA